ncbi:hypothetical protein ACHAXN_004363 [Cyclotella atomus]
MAAYNMNIEPDLTSGSISSDEDLEGGELQTFTVSTFKAGKPQEEEIVPKCVSFNGRRSRRLSSDNLPFRRMSRRTSDLTDNSESSRELPATHRPKRLSPSLRSSTSNSSTDKPKLHPKLLPSIFLTLLALTITYATHLWRVQHLHEKVQTLHEAHKTVEESHGKLSEELKTASHNIAQYNHMKRLKEEHTENLLKRATEAEDQLQEIMERVRQESLASIIETYGSDSIVVEMDVAFPFTQRQDETVRITLSSADMPHSTLTFLNQLSLQVWNGASLAFRGNSFKFKRNEKPTSGLHVPTTLFAERRDTSKHNEYTLSFSKGGDLYLNLVPSNGGFGTVDFKSNGVVEEMKGGGVVVKGIRVITKRSE